MEKIDYKKSLKELYRPSARRVTIVTAPAMNFLMIDGQGRPQTSQEFQDAVGALYPVAYALKFMVRNGPIAVDFGVMPLEGLWWANDMTDFVKGNKDRWKWRLMIMQPELITIQMFDAAVAQVKEKKNPPGLAKLRFERFEEGNAAQILHIGSFDDEGPTVAKIHRFIEDAGGRLSGRHHEIYLNDPRRTAPARLKTVVRQPFT
jgi:hypothetical protein